MSDSQNISGQNIDEYEVIERLAASQTGVVFKVRHRTMDRLAVVKVLSGRAAASPQMIERFSRTVKILAQLNHPNLVIAYRAGVYKGLPYVATEHIDGKDLRTLMKQLGPLPVANALSYVSQAAAGLQYAHSKGVYHRNIKPGNLMLDRKGVIKIIGMGLARVDVDSALAEVGAAERLTIDGQAMGSYEYMAPEQAVNAHDADARADIYSLGCTLYVLLTGSAPYPGESPMQILVAHSMAPIPSLRAARADVSAALDAVFQKMLAKKPADRYQSMAELLVDLELIMAGKEPPQETPVPGPQDSSGELPDDALPDDASQLSVAGAMPVSSAASIASRKRAKRKVESWPIVAITIGGVVLAIILFLIALHVGGGL